MLRPPFCQRAISCVPAWIALSLTFLFVHPLPADPLTTGNLVVYRVGTGTGPLVNTGNPVFLDEYTPAGALVQSIALPTALNGLQKRLVASGTATSDGLLTRSADGRFVILPGYDSPLPGASSLTGSTAASINRVIGRVDGAGVIDTSTALTDANDANNFRGVCSNDGTQFWSAGAGTGLRYAASLGATTSQQISTTNANLRQPLIANGQLYISSGNGSTVRLGTVGTGLPTTTGQVMATLPGYPTGMVSPNAFVLLDLDEGVAGVDTLYAADDAGTVGGVLKYSFNGSAWTARGTVGLAADGYRGLTATVSGGNVTLYVVRKGGSGSTGGGELVSLVDASGSTGTLTVTPMLLATALPSTTMRGVALTPITDLSVALSAPSSAAANGPFDYTLTVTNNGLANAAHVAVQFTLPADVNFVAASGAGFTANQAAGVVNFSGGTVNGASSATLTVSVSKTSAGSVSLPAGAAVVDPLNALVESNEGNNSSTQTPGTTVTDASDLLVSLNAPATAPVGANFDYTLTVSNNGLAAAHDVGMVFHVPDAISYVSSSAPGFTVTEDGADIGFHGGVLAAGGSAVITVTVKALESGVLTTVEGAAEIDPEHLIVESNEMNNKSAAVTTTVYNPSDLKIEMVRNGALEAGGAGSYTVTLSNVGTGDTQGEVTVSGTLPAGAQTSSFTGAGWSSTGSGAQLIFKRSDALAPGESYPALTFTTSVPLNSPDSIALTMTLAGGGELNAANNSATDTATVLNGGPGQISFGPSPLSSRPTTFTVAMEDRFITIPVIRTHGRAGTVRVRANSVNGTAAQADFRGGVDRVVEFADGEVEKMVTVEVFNHKTALLTSQFTLELSSPEGGAELGTASAAVVIILAPDRVKPVLTVSHPKENEKLAGTTIGQVGGPSLQVLMEPAYGRVTDNSDIYMIDRTEASVNNGPFVRAGIASPMSIPTPLPTDNYAAPMEGAVPGPNVIRVRATDLRGNVTEVVRSFIFDAPYVPTARPLTLQVLPDDAAGTVTITPSDEQLTTLQLGKVYILKATPRAGQIWNGWSSPQLSLTPDLAASTTLTFGMSEGLTIQANFMDAPYASGVVGAFNGLITATGGTVPGNETNGFITLKVTPTGSFTGTVKIDGGFWPLAGMVDRFGLVQFDAGRTNLKVLSRIGRPDYALALTMDMNPAGTHRITGTLKTVGRESYEAMSVVVADRAYFDGKTPATSAVVATYNVVLPAQAQSSGLTTSAFPQGAGIGSIAVTKQGVASLNATLADGSVMTASVPLSQVLTLPLFAQLYTNKAGSLGGLVTIDAAPANTDVSSPAMWWFKPWTGGQHYPFGWPEGVTLPLIGAKFVAPVGESVLPDLAPSSGANAKLAFSRGKLSANVAKEVAISISNVVTNVPDTDKSYVLTLTSATGRISGSFTHTDGTKPGFTGIILQKGANRRGFGHFLTTSPKVVDGSGESGDLSLVTKYNPRPALVISEFMAKNVSTIVDEDGDYSDWIEIYNPGTEPVDLLDWCLTDSAANLTKWRFPAVTLGAKQFLLVWASNKNRTTPGQPLHTNFALSNSGEYLALVRPDGVTIEHQFAPAFPALGDDESYGVNFTGRPLVSKGAVAKYLVPKNDALGSTWTSATFNDKGWAAVKTGIGFGVSVPGFKVRQVASSGAFIDSVASAEALLALAPGNAGIASETTVISQTLNFLGEGGDGHYDNNAVPPNGLPSPYVIKATGDLVIPVTGSYVFGLNSDDGGRIRIDGANVMVDDSNHGVEDHLSGPVTLTAGTHAVEVIMWEGVGGDALEFFAAPGSATSWNSDFKLVGSPSGLAVTTPPLGAAASTGAEVGTNVQTKMTGINASCYVRVPFNATGVGSLSGLTLQMRYNDGFIAYLNGMEIARRNAPASAGFSAAATGSRTSEETLVAETIDVSGGLPALINGTNVLAIHGMNQSAADASFLVLPELAGTAGLTGDAVFYHVGDSGPTATPQGINGMPSYLGEVADTKFSVKRGFFTAPFNVAITSATAGTTIRYTLDGSTPSAAHGTIYSRPLKVAKTSVVRAMAYKAGFLSTNVETQSYFFLDDVIRQSASGARPGGGWPNDTINGQVKDYGMDPQIVNNTNPEIGGATKVKEALAAIPTISLVTDLPNLFDPDNGIWVNPGARGFEWERPASMELIGDSNSAEGGFQVNCGIRVRGGFSRDGNNPKHGFHLYFRSSYGASKLNYPMFGGEGAGSFDQIDLRTAQNYSWSFGGDGSNTFIREETTRELQGAMGQPYGRGRYYHLYINGQYWGLYDTEERTEAGYSATYLGGSKENYDVVKGEQDSGYITGVTDGNLDAWQDLWTKARAHASDPTNARYFAMQGKAADGVTATADPVLLDADALIDYMLLTFWTGNLDGCTSQFLGDERANNWFGSRDRTGTKGFKFFAHDFEHTFFDINADRTGPFNVATTTDFTYSNPMFLHHDLRPNLEYRVRWGDRVQKHLFNGGALTEDNVIARMTTRAALVDKVIIAESARWGDSKTEDRPPLTRLDWQNAKNYLINDYVPNRASPVLQQLRADGLYPSFDAPALSQFGGDIVSGTEVSIAGNGGTIYLTLNGADPRQIGGAVNPAAQTYASSTSTETLLPLSQSWKYLADGSDQSTAWRLAGYDDSEWAAGPAELGYGDGDEATSVPFVDVDANAGGVQKNATTYFRSSFTAMNVSGITAASISLKVDDAAAVYINGVQALRTSNLPAGTAYNQYATSGTPDENAYVMYAIDPALLVEGANLIAAEVHQADANSSDISFSMSLSAMRTETPTPLYLTGTGSKRLKVRALSNGEWSALVDATFNAKQAPDLKVDNVAEGSFATGAAGAYTLTVRNAGTVPTTGAVTITDSLPPGLTDAGLSGAGWTVQQGAGGMVSATRSDALPAGQSYPALTLHVSIATTAPAFVTTVATVAGGGEIVTSNNTATNVIQVDGAGASQFLFSAASYQVNEEDGSVPVTIMRTGSRSGTATVMLSSSNGSAKSPGDYDAVNQTVSFADAEASQTVEIPIHGDDGTEPNETFAVKLDAVTGSVSLGAVTSAVVRILEQDSAAPKVVVATPTAGARVAATSVIVKGSATDNKGVGHVRVRLNQGTFADAILTSGVNTTSAAFSLPLVAPAGTNTVTVRAYDLRGNASNEVTRTFAHVPLRPLALTVTPAGAATTSLSPKAALSALQVGTSYVLKQKAKDGFVWSHWSGLGINAEAESLTFVMSEGLALTANYVANPFTNAVIGDYQGLVSSAVSVTPSHDNHGYLQLKITNTGAFTGTLKMGGTSLPVVGVFNADGEARFGTERATTGVLLRRDKPGLVLALTLNLSTLKIAGTVGLDARDGTQSLSVVTMDRAGGALAASSPYLVSGGRYNVTIAARAQTNGLTLSDFPQASGTGVITIAKAGTLSLAAKLCDGTRFTCSAALNGDLRAPLHAPLYAKQTGSFSALVALDDNAAGSDLKAEHAVWFRPVTHVTPYPLGWPQGLALELVGVHQ